MPAPFPEHPTPITDTSVLLAECQRRLHSLGEPQLANKVHIFWNKRMRSTAGRAFPHNHTVELNPRLINISNDEIWRTTLHELAHLLAHHRAGRKRIQPHGNEWQLACSQLGIPGEKATHSLPLPRRQQRKNWAYKCPACDAVIERTRRMKNLAACYSCCKKHNGGVFTQRFILVEYAIKYQ
ncbi:SprT-like domain-containing protein [Persicirhabdus sediminis]|uniref:SprT-like domain-containing protein n=1 Tax=Persicirhabdus sediminis TaxID=454144 RepID=A0A8J7SJA5_9BACT|nr:SprT-like domain-containing protein [Persicirhabdus sediminis]MBK1790991.1 SprT-like domain-containing protein [Persicirhabdus sediminis]